MTNILILEPSTSGLELLPNAHAMGLRIFVLSANSDERVIPDDYRKYIHQLIIVDTNNLALISDATLKVHQDSPLSAVLPGFEIYVAHAARLSQLIGVPGISPATGDMLRNKGLMRETLSKAGVKVPKYFVVNSCEKVSSISKKINYPCVIKPIDQSGSLHVSRVDNGRELLMAYDQMRNDKWTEMGKGVGSVAIVEEYVSGKEFSVEGYVDTEGLSIVSITEKFLAKEPYFVEMGHIVPANLSDATNKIIVDYVKSVIDAVNLSVGVFHCELRVNSSGAVLMEIAGRLAGDRICDLIYLAKGINLYQIMLTCHLGLAVEKVAFVDNKVAGIHYFSCPDKIFYEKIVGLEILEKTPGFQKFKLLINPGERVLPLTSFQGRVAYCIFTANSYQELTATIKLAIKSLQFI